MAARYDWILAQGAIVDESKWIRCDVKTRLYELGLSRVISTSPHCFRTILVEKEQELPLRRKSKSKKKILRYGILERLPFSPREIGCKLYLGGEIGNIIVCLPGSLSYLTP
jgi:hypothetical protein